MQSRDDRILLELVGDVMGLLDPAELRRGLAHALLRAVPADRSALNEIGPDRVVVLTEPDLDERQVDSWAALAHESPIYERWLRTRDGRPTRLSDVASRDNLERTRLFREVYRPLGIEHGIAFTLPHERNHMLSVELYRAGPDFSSAERDLLARARPFLIQAHRNAVSYSESRRERTVALEAALVEHGLTSREAEVLELVALGASNRDAADRLGISGRTAQKHLERAFRKLDVTSRSMAAQRAWELAREADRRRMMGLTEQGRRADLRVV